jgi:type I restriction enzyme S subunit
VELKPGYKQAEVGVIPEDWDVVAIGSVASFKSGDGISVAALREKSCDNPIPVYGGNGIAGYTTNALVQEPVVVVGRVGQKCGEVYLTVGPAWISDNALYPHHFHRRVDIRYFAFALGAAGLNDVKNRNDLPLVTQAILHSANIPVPSRKAEQRAIADVLSDADALIESLVQLLAKKRQLKQGAMQELLTGRRRLPGFHGTWEETRLSEVGTFLKGSGVSRGESLSGDFPCARYGEIYTRHNEYIKTFYSWVSRSVAKKATRLKHADILFAGSGETKEEIGKCVAFVGRFEAYAGGDIVILRTENADPVFLGFYLNTAPINRQKASRGQGDAVVHIGANALGDIKCKLPARAEQTAIAAVLSDMDAGIAALETKLAKARAIKQGMMQELLTGRIRLV